MLMFGPKNAKVKQEHFLHLLQDSKEMKEKLSAAKDANSKTNILLEQIRSYGGIVLMMYEMEGIPMGDVFKVLQYYLFLPKEDQPALYESACSISVGVLLHFRKSSMFKIQIISGTQEESVVQATKWIESSEKKVGLDSLVYKQEEIAEEGGDEDDEDNEEVENGADGIHSNELAGASAVGADGNASSTTDDRRHSLNRRRSSIKGMQELLAVEEQKLAISNATTISVEKAIHSLKQEFQIQILFRDRIIQGLLLLIVLFLLILVILLWKINDKLAGFANLLKK
jgi:hypothetical protein